MSKEKILIVEDDRFYQELYCEVLEEEGYEVDSTFTGEEAISKVKEKPYNLMVLDMVLPGIDGQEVLSRVKQIRPTMDVIITTGYASVESAVKALKTGASDYLTKPINPEELKLSIKRCIEIRGLFEENSELKSLLKLYQNVQLVSSTLEIEKLYELSLDAVIHSLNASIGIGFFRTEENQPMQLKSFRGIDESTAKLVVQYATARYVRNGVKDILSISNLTPPNGVTLPKVGVLVPFNCKNAGEKKISCKGAVVAFRDYPFTDKEIANARFLSEQISLSLANALTYTGTKKMIFVDDLSGLYNTRYLDISLENEIKRAKRFKSSLSLLFIDLDYFKEVNDTYGHLVGSRLLHETAQVLKRGIREVDIPIRYGGDEFIIILVETGREGAVKVAERLRKTIEEHEFVVGENIRIKMTCCVGVASYPEDAQTKIDLIHLADKAMYRGKETTRNCVYSAASL